MPALLTTSDAVTNAAALVLESGEFKGGAGRDRADPRTGRVESGTAFAGWSGKAKSLSVNGIRKAAGTALRAAKPRGLRDVTVIFPDDHALSDEHLGGSAVRVDLAG